VGAQVPDLHAVGVVGVLGELAAAGARAPPFKSPRIVATYLGAGENPGSPAPACGRSRDRLSGDVIPSS
jgi:hypothetical protein